MSQQLTDKERREIERKIEVEKQLSYENGIWHGMALGFVIALVLVAIG